MATYTIRPFRDDDRALITEFRNARLPAHLKGTVAEWERADLRKPEGEVILRLCAVGPDDRPVAYLSAVDRGTSAWRKPGDCGIDVEVAAAQQRQGVGGALYERGVEFARQRGLARLAAFVQCCRPDTPAVRFLEQRSFTETDREVPVMLDLATFNRAQFVSPAPEGILFFSYAEAGDTDDNRHALYALMTALVRDIPTNDVMPESPVYEQWVKDLETPEWDSNALILAADAAGQWIGISQLGFQEGTGIAWTFLTGILPQFRGLGIAYALKLRALDAAIARRCPLILTENHEDNAPMRAINRKLGFVFDAPDVSYMKDI